MKIFDNFFPWRSCTYVMLGLFLHTSNFRYCWETIIIFLILVSDSGASIYFVKIYFFKSVPFLLPDSGPQVSHLHPSSPSHPTLLWPRPVTLIPPKLGEERGAVCRWLFNLERRMAASEGGKGESRLPPLQTLGASLGSAPSSAPLTHPLPTRTPPLESL